MGVVKHRTPIRGLEMVLPAAFLFYGGRFRLIFKSSFSLLPSLLTQKTNLPLAPNPVRLEYHDSQVFFNHNIFKLIRNKNYLIIKKNCP